MNSLLTAGYQWHSSRVGKKKNFTQYNMFIKGLDCGTGYMLNKLVLDNNLRLVEVLVRIRAGLPFRLISTSWRN